MKHDIGIPVVEKTFSQVLSVCKRSSTKNDLHPDPAKEKILYSLLQKVYEIYGTDIADSFQAEYENTDPGLSYLFAHLTNAVLEKAFHDGSCHSQSSYAMFELSKEGIFNVSMVSSQTGNPGTDHFYLMMPDEYTRKILSTIPNVFIHVNKSNFAASTVFFDTWSKILCKWQDFKGPIENTNKCTKVIKTSTQYLFRPLDLLFKDELTLLKNIKKCLLEYKMRLQKVPIHASALLVAADEADKSFKEEVQLLTSSEKCVTKLVETIDEYVNHFKIQIEALKEKELPSAKLARYSSRFFEKYDLSPGNSVWKVHPQASSNDRYKNYDVRYFNMPISIKEQATLFNQYLNKKKINTELQLTEGKPACLIAKLDKMNPF
jgi:hypothetical protein